jgi:hypothetical protein
MPSTLPSPQSRPTRSPRFGRRRSVPLRALGVGVIGLATLPFVAPAAGAASDFSAGDLVVYRVGDGTTAITGNAAAAPVSLDQFSPTGADQTPSLSLPLPVTAAADATSEGLLTLSTDGTTLVAGGYDAPVGTASVATSSVPRLAVEVDAAGDVDTSTVAGQYPTTNLRSVATVDGSRLWLSGAAGGVTTELKGGTTGTQLSTTSNMRAVEIYGSQVYASTATGQTGIYAIGSGLPTSGETQTQLPGLDSGSGSSATSPYAFVLFHEGSEPGSAPDTAYVADTNAGIEKWVLEGSTWEVEGLEPLSGITGLTGTYVDGVATLYATAPGSLVSLTDPYGQDALPPATPLVTLATAPSDEAFRGVAFAPTAGPTTPPPALPEVPDAALLPLAAATLIGGGWFARRRRVSHSTRG